MFKRKTHTNTILQLDPDLFLVTKGAKAGFVAVVAELRPASALVVFTVWKGRDTEPTLVCGHMNLTEKKRDTSTPLLDKKGNVLRVGDELAWHTDQSLVTRDNVGLLVQRSGVKSRKTLDTSKITVFALNSYVGSTLVNYVRQVTCLTGIKCTMKQATFSQVMIDMRTGAQMLDEQLPASVVLVPQKAQRLTSGRMGNRKDIQAEDSQEEREKCQSRVGVDVARLVMDNSAQKPLSCIDLRYFWRRPKFTQVIPTAR